VAHPGTINNLRYLKRQLLVPEQTLQKNYFREVIHQYGVDATYYRHDSGFFETPSAIHLNYTYGEDTTVSYWLSSPVVVYMQAIGDSILLNKFGIETDGDFSVYILKEDFTEQFRDLVGSPVQQLFSTTISADISGFSGIISGDIINDEISGFTSALIENLIPGQYEQSFVGDFTRYPKRTNEYTYKSPSYTERNVNGSLSGSYTVNVDIGGVGTASGQVSGTLSYYNEEPGKNNGPHWYIAPQVGDFFRLDFNEDNREEYEITRVYDKELTVEGMNQLLSKYIWKMDVVRRDPSYENVIGGLSGNIEEEKTTADRSQFEEWHETVSNEIFNYDERDVDSVDKQNSDSVYGGYGRIDNQ